MGYQNQTQGGWFNRNVQSLTSVKRIHPKGGSWLWGNFFTSSKVCLSSPHSGHCYKLEFGLYQMDVVSARDPRFEAFLRGSLGSFGNIKTTMKWWTEFARFELILHMSSRVCLLSSRTKAEKRSCYLVFRSRNQLRFHAWCTSLGLGPEFRYVIGKVLGTQDRPALQLAFICITFGLI